MMAFRARFARQIRFGVVILVGCGNDGPAPQELGGIVPVDSSQPANSPSAQTQLQTLDLAFYPEGGDLVGGVENRVYLEARTPWGKPADIEGRIVDSLGVRVARYRTEHEGRGRFSFTPRPGETYSLQVDSPAGITRLFPLPVSVDDGVALRARVDSRGRVKVQLDSPTARDLEVVADLVHHRRRIAEPALALDDHQLVVREVRPPALELRLVPAPGLGQLHLPSSIAYLGPRQRLHQLAEPRPFLCRGPGRTECR